MNYEAPSQAIFDEMKETATQIWSGYDDSHGYASGKIGYINSFGNVGDNAMVMYRMFDSSNQGKFIKLSSPQVLTYIAENL
jgi:hypothetical protein